jgi:hypothetical protein
MSAPGDPAALSADPLPREPKTDLGYARRLVRLYGGRLRYVYVPADAERTYNMTFRLPDGSGYGRRFEDHPFGSVLTDDGEAA